MCIDVVEVECLCVVEVDMLILCIFVDETRYRDWETDRKSVV